MTRLFALAATSLCAAPVFADDPPKGGGQVQLLVAKVEGDKLVTSTTTQFQRAVSVTDKDGAKAITVTETNVTSTARELKFLKATDTEDKAKQIADDFEADHGLAEGVGAAAGTAIGGFFGGPAGAVAGEVYRESLSAQRRRSTQ